MQTIARLIQIVNLNSDQTDDEYVVINHTSKNDENSENENSNDSGNNGNDDKNDSKEI